jgi:hypothetical protein
LAAASCVVPPPDAMLWPPDFHACRKSGRQASTGVPVRVQHCERGLDAQLRGGPDLRAGRAQQERGAAGRGGRRRQAGGVGCSRLLLLCGQGWARAGLPVCAPAADVGPAGLPLTISCGRPARGPARELTRVLHRATARLFSRECGMHHSQPQVMTERIPTHRI